MPIAFAHSRADDGITMIDLVVGMTLFAIVAFMLSILLGRGWENANRSAAQAKAATDAKIAMLQINNDIRGARSPWRDGIADESEIREFLPIRLHPIHDIWPENPNKFFLRTEAHQPNRGPECVVWERFWPSGDVYRTVWGAPYDCEASGWIINRQKMLTVPFKDKNISGEAQTTSALNPGTDYVFRYVVPRGTGTPGQCEDQVDDGMRSDTYRAVGVVVSFTATAKKGRSTRNAVANEHIILRSRRDYAFQRALECAN